MKNDYVYNLAIIKDIKKRKNSIEINNTIIQACLNDNEKLNSEIEELLQKLPDEEKLKYEIGEYNDS